jgi:hypothetical protein
MLGPHHQILQLSIADLNTNKMLSVGMLEWQIDRVAHQIQVRERNAKVLIELDSVWMGL